VDTDKNGAYVHAALLLQGYELDAMREAAVAAQFARIAEIAVVFVQDELPLALEPAPVFLP
jgi:hypothetical protein